MKFVCSENSIQYIMHEASRAYNLTLYAPCIILQYVYKPTRFPKFL